MSGEPKTRCPQCGNRHFQIVVRQMADVGFDEDGDHELTDGPYGDVEWDDDSFAICADNLGGCGWAGTLKELVGDTGIEPVTPTV